MNSFGGCPLPLLGGSGKHADVIDNLGGRPLGLFDRGAGTVSTGAPLLFSPDLTKADKSLTSKETGLVVEKLTLGSTSVEEETGTERDTEGSSNAPERTLDVLLFPENSPLKFLLGLLVRSISSSSTSVTSGRSSLLKSGSFRQKCW